MKTSESTKEIFAALSKAQGKLENIAKKKDGYGYKYAELSEILEQLRPIFKDCGLVIMQSTEILDKESMVLVTRVGHASGEWVEGITPMYHMENKKTNKMQALASSISYARRYGICSLVSIGLEDDDGKSAAPSPEERQQRQESGQKREEPPKQRTIESPIADEHIDVLVTDYSTVTTEETYLKLREQVVGCWKNLTDEQRTRVSKAGNDAKARLGLK